MFCLPLNALAIRAAGLAACLNIPREVIKNRLPSVALLFKRMTWLAIECHTYCDAFRLPIELDLRSAVTKSIFDQFVFHDICIGPREIESKAAVLCFHAGREVTACT